MKHWKFILVLLLLFAVITASISLAQGRRDRRRRGFDDWQNETPPRDFPVWELDKDFADDVFTFVRIQYDSYGGGYGYGRGGGGWRTDYDGMYYSSDINFSLRLQQLTSLKVNPKPVILELTDPELFDYPFIYIIEPGALFFHDDEIKALRRYLDNGGFLMVDDFWGQSEWMNFYEQIRRVFPEPNRAPEELRLSHPIFHCVYDMKELPQVPSIDWARRGKSAGITYEPRYDGSDMEPHYWAIKDDAGRIMVLICHNTDLGDGWEREGVEQWYFEEFSVKKAYPMGINIVTYAMTH